MYALTIRWSLIGSTVAALAACGPDYVPPTISGFAATGAAMANANVTARCVSGPELTGTTDANGLFVLTLNNQTAPCIVRVASGGVTLHSFANGSGRLNVTPLTELSVGKALGADPATVFASFDGTKASTIANGLAAAKASIKTQVEALTGASISGDIFTSSFRVGEPDDVVLDKFAAKLQAIGRPFSSLQANAATGSSLLLAVQAAARGSLASPQGQGTLVDAGTLNVVAPAQLVALTGPARCGIELHQIHYNTAGILGETATASGALLLPRCPSDSHNGALLAYGKGTDVDRVRTLARLDDSETMLLAMMYAAQGYTVVATDYLGFAKSSYNFHPYLHAETQAASIIDSIRAARIVAQNRGVALSGDVILTGYSQGGHASMAAQRTIEGDSALANEISVVAAAHLAGPYNLAQALELNAPILGYQVFVPYMITSWQKIYNDLYTKASDVFKAPYASYIETLLPSSQYSYETLYSSQSLPYVAPDQALALMFDAAYMQAVQTNASHPLRIAGLKNQLLGWGPKADVMLCSGSQDPTVPFQLHQLAAYQDLNSRATASRTLATRSPYQSRSLPAGTVLYYEVTGSNQGSVYGNGIYTDDSSLAAAAVHAGVLASGQTGVVKVTLLGAQTSYSGTASNGVTSMNWAQWDRSYSVSAAGPAPEKVISVDVNDTVMQLHGQSFDITKYHGTYVPPLCHAQARQFFNQKLPS